MYEGEQCWASFGHDCKYTGSLWLRLGSSHDVFDIVGVGMESSETTWAYSVVTTNQEEPKLQTKPRMANNDVPVVLVVNLVVELEADPERHRKPQNPQYSLKLTRTLFNPKAIVLKKPKEPPKP